MFPQLLFCSSGIIMEKDQNKIHREAIWSEELKIWQYSNENIYMIWYKNGQLKGRCLIKNGNLNGLWESWYENGNKEMLGNRLNNEPDGIWYFWWPNGNIKMVGKYNEGKEIDEWLIYDKNGRNILKYYYENGIFKKEEIIVQ